MFSFAAILTVTVGFPNICLNNFPVLYVYLFYKTHISEINNFSWQKSEGNKETHNEL